MSRYFVGITGGSGHPYAIALIRALLENGQDVDTSVTEAGIKVLRHEVGIDPGVEGANLGPALTAYFRKDWGERLRAFPTKAIEAPPSSGTALTGGVIVCPCSMGTLARVSVGFSSNLVERAVDVALKERRTLVLVTREAPYSPIHLENMLRMARLGAVILPASPGFYHRPRTLEDLVEHVVGKVLDTLRVPHSVGARWKGLPPPDEDAGTGVPPPRDPLAPEERA